MDSTEKNRRVSTPGKTNLLIEVRKVVRKCNASTCQRQQDGSSGDLRNLLVGHGSVARPKVYPVGFFDIRSDKATYTFSASDSVVADCGLWMLVLVGSEPLFIKQ